LLETELRKHSSISSILRQRVLTKKAGLRSMAGKIVETIGTHPGKSLLALAGGLAALGTHRSVRNRLSPEAHRAALGIPPP
jgi:hypothetical protein